MDALRAVLAFWVVLSHFPVPFSDYFPIVRHSILLRGLLGESFCGVAAVMVFFIISGFCIHLPYIDGAPLKWSAYVIRREIRIGIPLLSVILVGVLLRSTEYTAVIWSLVCEEIYYAMYPAILHIRRAYGWQMIWVFTVITSLIGLILTPSGGNFWTPNYLLTAMLALPVWVSGCCLAEISSEIPPWHKGKREIWILRLAVWVCSLTANVLRFHGGVGFTYSMLVFSSIGYFWLRAELSFYKRFEPWAWLEKCGKGSYTLYLTHKLGPPLLLYLGILATGVLAWPTTMIAIFALAWAFYMSIELPSHRLARYTSNSLVRPKEI